MINESLKVPEGIHTLVLGLGDTNGILRGKRIPTEHWPTICENGNALSIAMFAIDMTCDVWDTPYVNFDNGYPDFHIMPLGPVRPIPWEEGVAFCFGRGEGTDHKPVPIDPRNALIRVVEQAESLGYQIQIGAELEFYLLDKDTLQPRDKNIQVYGLARAAEWEPVLGPIRQNLSAMGIPIEQSNPEYAPGQAEVNLRYSNALESADRVVVFRNMVKELALQKGYVATFMSKPFNDQSGNGFHTHHSISKDGRNILAEQGKLSALGMNYLAGLQKHMSEISLAAAGTPNAYRRRQPYSFCPINTTWGIDNRTVALRVIEGKDAMVRIEKRDGSADCNPYLLMATEIAAGLKGIEQRLQPSPITQGNAYEAENAEPIPTDLATAIALAKESALMHEVYGEDLLKINLTQAERELEFFQDQITAVEKERYLGNF